MSDMNIPRRTAIVASRITLMNMPDGHCAPKRATVTLARMPWEPEVTNPDPRNETAPRRNPSPLPVRAYKKHPAPPPGIMDGGDFS